MSRSPNPILLFDGVCNLCNATVNFVIDHDRAGVVRFAALQSDAGRALLATHGLAGDYLDSLVFIEGDAVWVGSDGAVRLTRYLGFPWRAARVLVWIPRWLREPAYRWIARNRYRWFGRQESCRMPTDALRARFIEQAGG